MELVFAAIIALLIYWLLYRVTAKLSVRTRILVILLYTVLYGTTWLIMHYKAADALAQATLENYNLAQRRMKLELAHYTNNAEQISAKTLRLIRGRVYSRPSSSVYSIAVAPFLVVCAEFTSVGPENAGAEVCMYFYTGWSLETLWRRYEWTA
jgi:hypothetical protein